MELQDNIQQIVINELQQYQPKQIKAVLKLLADDNTVPFIARYRKEQTGSLDEVQIRQIHEAYDKIFKLEQTKEQVTAKIKEQGKLTEELTKAIQKAQTITQLEDIYRPFKQKRRTKATIAKENGLEPLALQVLTSNNLDVANEATQYLNEEVPTVDDILAGVIEIIAEAISDNPNYRKYYRKQVMQKGILTSSLKKNAQEDERQVYSMYYDYQEQVKNVANHRILAINRGEREKILKVNIEVPTEQFINALVEQLKVANKQNQLQQEIITQSIKEALKRFILPAIEREIRNELTERAEEQAINLFGDNLSQLLLQAPFKGKVVMGYDPAYRTGCKLAIVDETGKLLNVSVIYPTQSPKQNVKEAAKTFKQLIEDYQVEMIAIGNGTASRESEQFVSEQLKDLDRTVYYTIVNEAGASVYSASENARKEFPDLQVEERSAISIARRLQDPLAELVKIDPKSVGVGQYQHDVSQKKLNEQLDFVVETAVNKVGVDLNTASKELLTHISGLNQTIAKNIVEYRDEHGTFTNRTEVKNVPRLGPKAFEQAIGFLRIPQGDNILDQTDIHPEVYDKVWQIIEDLQIDPTQIGTTEVSKQLENIDIKQLADQYELGEATLKDIIQSLAKPGRDIRDEMPKPILRTDVLSMDDLQVGMKLKGTIRNIVDFGVFVDIGVKQDGLVHISQISNKYIKHPSEMLSVGDIVQVSIIEIDKDKNRIGLSMLEDGAN